MVFIHLMSCSLISIDSNYSIVSSEIITQAHQQPCNTSDRVLLVTLCGALFLFLLLYLPFFFPCSYSFFFIYVPSLCAFSPSIWLSETGMCICLGHVHIWVQLVWPNILTSANLNYLGIICFMCCHVILLIQHDVWMCWKQNGSVISHRVHAILITYGGEWCCKKKKLVFWKCIS